MYRIIVCIVLLSGTIGEIIREGPCNFESINRVTDLNITQMTGEWYQLKRIENAMENGACSTLAIAVSNSNTSVPNITISHREVHHKVAHLSNGVIIPVIPQGKFVMQFSNFSYESVVIATDYSKYALLYSCMPVVNTNQSSVVAWVYSRQKSLPEVEQDANFLAAVNGTDDLRNATWVVNHHTKEACNAGISFGLSPILTLLAAVIVGKEYIGLS